MTAALWEICHCKYFRLNLRIRSGKTRYQYEVALRSFERSLGHAPTIADLNDDSITLWMGQLLAQEKPALSTHTVRERVNRVLALWTWLHKRGVVPTCSTVIKPQPPEPLPQALTEEQLRRLFESANKERGTIDDIPANLWWCSFLAFVWNTSERKGAALAVKIAWLDLEAGMVAIPPEARKGRLKWGVYEIWPETIKLLRRVIAVNPARDLVWPWDRHEGSYYTSYNRILRDAGIPVTRKTKTHGLRCSHATYLKVAGGDPMQQLGHSDMATTVRHYLDPKLTRVKQPKLLIPWTSP